MSYSAKIILDSCYDVEQTWGTCDGVRLTTMEVTFPRFILSEFNTHRAFSRNSASSRAIPIAKQIERIRANPVIPIWTGKKAGMQGEDIDNEELKNNATAEWLYAMNEAIETADWLDRMGLHKQNANRLLEPFMWHTVIVTATEWDNFFELRNNSMAQPEMQKIAQIMQAEYDNPESIPQYLNQREWHIPFIQDEEKDLPLEVKRKISVARCARVSYLTHDGKRDLVADYVLYDRLWKERHLSPFEHVAQLNNADYVPSNFSSPWLQFRKLFEYGWM